jgi:hypothetical protein
MSQSTASRLQALIDFVLNCPENEQIEAMDCNEHCEQMAVLAERVAAGASLEDILPELEHHMRYWRDCREEFAALVAVLKMEAQQRERDA